MPANSVPTGADQPNEFWDDLEYLTNTGLLGKGSQPNIGANATTPVVLAFPGATTHQNVYVPDFWDTTVTDLGVCYWEALVMQSAALNGGYWLSEGFGGSHAMLAGINGTQPNGNVLIAGLPVSFAADYAVTANEWLHMGVAWDGAYVWCFINGIALAKVAASGARTAQQGSIYIGGSDHSSLDGRIAAVRGFEGVLPNFNPSTPPNAVAFSPEIPFLDGNYESTPANPPAASFLHEYTVPGRLVIPDLGQGYRGRSHAGKLMGTSVNGTPENSRGFNGPPWPAYVQDATFPWQPSGLVQPTRTVHAARTVPVGAKVFDSFARKDALPIWLAGSATSLANALGSTEGGSLGPLTWQQNSSLVYPRFGILSGMALEIASTASSKAWVVSNSGDMDVRGDNYPVFGNIRMGLIFRLSDASNYWSVDVNGASGSANVTLNKYVANAGGFATTTLISAAAPASWTTLRVLASGTSISVYVDNGSGGWTQIGTTQTDTFNQTATGAGLHSDGNGPSSTTRVQNFTVI